MGKVSFAALRVLVNLITVLHLYGTPEIEFRPNQPPSKEYVK